MVTSDSTSSVVYLAAETWQLNLVSVIVLRSGILLASDENFMFSVKTMLRFDIFMIV